MFATQWFDVSVIAVTVPGSIAAVIAAWHAIKLRRPVAEVHAAVSTPPNVDPLGAVVSDALDAMHDVQHTLENGHD